MNSKKGLQAYVGLKMAGTIILGLVFLGIGIYLLLNPTEYEFKTTATISKIEVTGGEWVSYGDTEQYEDTYSVYVSYEFDGRLIENAELGSYDSGMNVGDSIEIQFNSDDLMHVGETGFDFLPIVFIVLGGISAAIGIIEIIKLTRVR